MKNMSKIIKRIDVPFTSYKEWISYQIENDSNIPDDADELIKEYLQYLKKHNEVQYHRIIDLECLCAEEN